MNPHEGIEVDEGGDGRETTSANVSPEKSVLGAEHFIPQPEYWLRPFRGDVIDNDE